MPAGPLDQPALAYPEDELAAGRPADGKMREAMVLFRDGTWRLCRVEGWQQDKSGAWRVLLRWGVSGEVFEGWYVYDEARVHPDKASR